MNSLLSLSLIAAATAFADKVPQAPLLHNACPSDSLFSGECRPSNTQLATDALSSHSNKTQAFAPAYQPPARSDSSDIPWTFWPECYANEDTPEPYCVFSLQSFANGRGISIVTTSSGAADVLRKPAFTQPEILDYVNDHDNPPFEERMFPGKGRGLVANKTLHRGDEIFASTPLLLMDPGSYNLVAEERLKLAHRAVENLPKKTKPLFWELLGHFNGDKVDDRINTNAFDININGKNRHVVLPEIARMNHDCRPNAAYFWDEETLTHYVHATETIYPGQEITITYIDNSMTRDDRVDLLKQNWGFVCGCSACQASPAFTKESDARLAQMEEFEETLQDWKEDSKASPAMAELLIELVKQERLFGSLGGAYKLAAQAYSAVGDRWNAIKYARLSIDYLMLDRGFRDPDVRSMQKLAVEPEMQWSWKKRVNVHGCGCGRH